MEEKQRQEIEESIEMRTLEKRIEEINKQLVGKNIKFKLGKIKKVGFHYEIKTVGKNEMTLSSRYLIGKIEVLEYICGLEKGLQLGN